MAEEKNTAKKESSQEKVQAENSSTETKTKEPKTSKETSQKKQVKKSETIKKTSTKKEETKKKDTGVYPDVQPGRVVEVHQEISEKNAKGEEKKRIQVFKGMVLARKHGSGINATITVRKVSGGIGVEKIFPLHLPTVKEINVVKKFKVRRAKLNYLRNTNKKLREIKPENQKKK